MKIQRFFTEVLFSHQCRWCKLPISSEMTLCSSCKAALPFCRDSLILPAVDNIIAVFDYQPPISDWISRLKFNGDLSLIRFFSAFLVEKIKTLEPLPTLIIPAPLHPTRLKKRGFNQALEIAKPTGKFFNIPVDSNSVIKLKHTEPQTTLTRAARLKNLKNVFGLTKTISTEHVAIVDDVITTGTTISHIASLLYYAGVSTVSAWCCARTSLQE